MCELAFVPLLTARRGRTAGRTTTYGLTSVSGDDDDYDVRRQQDTSQLKKTPMVASNKKKQVNYLYKPK